MSETVHLGLPLLEASQAQKHVTHNEALLLLDAAIQLSVISRAVADPPALPVEGDRYLVAAAPAGNWAGQAGSLAFFEAMAWRFSVPRPGWRLWVEDESRFLVFDGTVWKDIQDIDVLNNMSLLGVNTTADAGNRLAVASASVLLTHEGSDQRLKINKQADTDTASLLFQTSYSGRAEMGLAGDDNFHVKVSADGSTWHEAIEIDRNTGAVSLPNTAVDVSSVFPSILSLAGQVVTDGVTDNAAVIQTALDSLAGTGGTVLLPPGRIRFDTALLLQDHVCLAGAGRDLTVLVEGTGLGSGDAMYNVNYSLVDGSLGAPGIIIRDLTIDGALREPPKWLSKADGTPVTDPEADYLPGGCLAPASQALLNLEVSNGQVSAVTILSGGSGYDFLPAVWVSGDGYGARIGVTISGGAVATAFIQDSGTGYTAAAAVVAGGGADPAVALYAADRRNSAYAVLPKTVTFVKAYNPRIENVGFYRSGGNAITDAGCNRLIVRDCHFEEGGQSDFVGSCIWTGGYGSNPQTEPYYRNSSDLTFEGNSVKDWKRSIATISSIRPVFSNNVIDGWGESCFFVTDKAVSPMIRGNRARRGKATDILCAFVEGVNDTSVIGNHVEDCDGRNVTIADHGGSRVIGNCFVAPQNRVRSAPFGPFSERVGYSQGSQPIAGSQFPLLVSSAIVLSDQDSSPLNAPKSFIMSDNRFSHDGGGSFAYALDFSRGALNAIGDVILTGNDITDAPGMGLFNAANAAMALDPAAQFIVENNPGQTGGNDPLPSAGMINGEDTLSAAPNGSFERGDYGWTKGSGWSIENDPANAKTGNWVARNADLAVTSSTLLSNNFAGVAPGETVQAEAWLKASGTAGLTMRVQIVWYSKDKAQLSVSSGFNYTTDQPAYVASTVAASAPASAVFFKVRVTCTKTAGTVWVGHLFAFRRRDAVALLSAGTVTSALLGGDITQAGKDLLDDVSAVAQRATLGLGSAAMEDASAFAPASHGHAAMAPAGGGAGTILRKASAGDYDFAWTPETGTDITAMTATLAADVVLAASNTWYDGPALTLDAGTWLVSGQITQVRATTTAEFIYGRITDGTVHYASQQAHHASATGSGNALSMLAILTLAAPATVKLQCATSAGNAVSAMKAALSNNGSGNNATQINAIRLA